MGTATRELVDTLRHEDDILLGAAVSPDGRWLALPAVVEADDGVSGRLQVWDLSTPARSTASWRAPPGRSPPPSSAPTASGW